MTCRLCISVYVLNTQNTLKNRLEQNFQDVAQKVQLDKNLDTSAAHSAQNFDQNPTPQQCREIMEFEILSTINPIRWMKTWSKYSCTVCTKEKLEIISSSRCRYDKLMNACSELYRACRHNPRFHRFTRH